MARRQKDGQAERVHPLAWIFYTILLPLLFTVVMIGVALQIFGYNVTGALDGYAASLPVVGRLFSPARATQSARPHHANVWKVTAGRDAIALRSAHRQLVQLQAELAREKTASGRYSQQLTAVRAQLKALQAKRAAAAKEGQVLANMTASQAALILMQQPIAAQVPILQAMSTTDQASLLAALPPKTAARLLQAGG